MDHLLVEDNRLQSVRITIRFWSGVRPYGRCLSPLLAPHVHGEPGAKSFVDDLIQAQGFVSSRAATSLRSIGSHPSCQPFVGNRCTRIYSHAHSYAPVRYLGFCSGPTSNPTPCRPFHAHRRPPLPGGVRACACPGVAATAVRPRSKWDVLSRGRQLCVCVGGMERSVSWSVGVLPTLFLPHHLGMPAPGGHSCCSLARSSYAMPSDRCAECGSCYPLAMGTRQAAGDFLFFPSSSLFEEVHFPRRRIHGFRGTLRLPVRVAPLDWIGRFCRWSWLRGRSVIGVLSESQRFTRVGRAPNGDGSECDGSYRL
ncbi:hypothetical protein chiPu_0003069 [Chiloscyllium punctatum]|uniref:Uncharacterized protein n=1 Tax=Chiloscyllium punctatum TaxID=137246 RepID=A0A401S2P1_CHIPU|nr:hypothetical protein [Chiloscyllium punctatum]